MAPATEAAAAMSGQTSILTAAVERARAAGDANLIVAAIPFARFMGIAASGSLERPEIALPFQADLIGNPFVPAIHGGAMGAFLELAAVVTLLSSGRTKVLPKLMTSTVEFLRPGREKTVYAEAKVERLGSSLATMGVTAWQDGRDRPVALATARFLLK